MIRHGESQWNRENRFTGWHDVDLTETGLQQARQAGRLLAEQNFVFDMACTSVLTRAIRTLWLLLDEMQQMYIPVYPHWRLNERHYGALQGLDKAETAAKHGEQQVLLWRRSYDIPPPALNAEEAARMSEDARYRQLDARALPRSESLKDTIARVLPYWHDSVVPAIRDGKRVLIAAHGNSLRALVKYLDELSEEAVLALNIPTGVPLVYELDAQLRPLQRRFLGDPQQIEKMMQAVANQGKAAGG